MPALQREREAGEERRADRADFLRFHNQLRSHFRVHTCRLTRLDGPEVRHNREFGIEMQIGVDMQFGAKMQLEGRREARQEKL